MIEMDRMDEWINLSERSSRAQAATSPANKHQTTPYLDPSDRPERLELLCLGIGVEP
jgi:hypothetical protein